MTLLELIQKTTLFLEKKGIDESRLQIELLLAHLLKLKRIQLYLQFERELSEQEMEPLRDWVRRRADHEPLQYILGTTEFYGLEFKVDKRALIPRRETEHLVETALELYSDKNIPLHAIDLGTGTGILAITLATHLPNSHWTATDDSSETLSLARENAEHHKLSGRIRWLESHWWNNIAADEKYDLIVSNPPYIKTADIAGLAPELKDHEPLVALDGGIDGLNAYRAILASAKGHANPGARLVFEIGFDQADSLQKLLPQFGWKFESKVKDLQGHDRVIVASLL